MKNTEISKGMERITSFFDPGTFTETGAYVKRKDGEAFEGVICGYGSVGGKLTFAFAQDPDRMSGAFDSLHAGKIVSIIEAAVKNGAPVVGFFDSLGAVINEGAQVLAAYGKVMKAVAEASGIIPTVAVISGICGGSSAVFASMFDFVICCRDSSDIYFSPRYEAVASDYPATVLADDESSALAAVRDILSYIPQNNSDGVEIETVDDLNKTVSVPIKDGRCDNRSLISLLADGGKYTELFSGYDESMITVLTSIGGVPVGLIANDSFNNSGSVTTRGAQKALKLLSFCDGFGIPVVTLVDTDGVDKNADVNTVSKLVSAYASSTNAKVTVYTGSAVGTAFNVMGSKSLGADVAFALEGSTISVMKPESAVAFLWNDKVANEKRKNLEEKWKSEFAGAAHAAECGEIDDIIPAAETRQRICAALMMLSGKSCFGFTRKHYNTSI